MVAAQLPFLLDRSSIYSKEICISLFVNMLYFICIMLLSIKGPLATNVKLQSCGNGQNELSSVDISPCPEQPCVFKIGTVLQLSIKYITKNVARSGKFILGYTFQGQTKAIVFDKLGPDQDGQVVNLAETFTIPVDLVLKSDSFMIAIIKRRKLGTTVIMSCGQIAVKIVA